MKIENVLNGLTKYRARLRSLRMARCFYIGDMDKRGIKIEKLMQKKRQHKIKQLLCKIKAYEYIVDLVDKNKLGDDSEFDEFFGICLEEFEHKLKADDYHFRIFKIEN